MMDEIEKLAREHGTGGWQTLADMIRFGRAVQAAERERCLADCDDVGDLGAELVAQRIRDRMGTPNF